MLRSKTQRSFILYLWERTVPRTLLNSSISRHRVSSSLFSHFSPTSPTLSTETVDRSEESAVLIPLILGLPAADCQIDSLSPWKVPPKRQSAPTPSYIHTRPDRGPDRGLTLSVSSAETRTAFSHQAPASSNGRRRR